MSVTAHSFNCSGQDSLPQAMSCCPVSFLHSQQPGSGATSWRASCPSILLQHGQPSHGTMQPSAPAKLPSCQGAMPQFKAKSHTFQMSRRAAWSMPKGPCWGEKADHARVLLPAQRHQGKMALRGTDGSPHAWIQAPQCCKGCWPNHAFTAIASLSQEGVGQRGASAAPAPSSR